MEVWGQVPAGSRGGAPVGVCGRSPQKLDIYRLFAAVKIMLFYTSPTSITIATSRGRGDGGRTRQQTCVVGSDVKFHEIFRREIFLEIFLKYFKNFTMDYGCRLYSLLQQSK